MIRKVTRDSVKTRHDILRAAEYEFAEKGFYGARVDEIAAKAEINKRMIYEYFGNKEQLYKTVLITVYSRLGELEVNLLTQDSDCIDVIRRIIKLHFDFLHDNPTYHYSVKKKLDKLNFIWFFRNERYICQLLTCHVS